MKKLTLLTASLAAYLVMAGPSGAQAKEDADAARQAVLTTFASMMKSYEAALTTFRDRYNATPGDMKNADGRLPGCPDKGGGSCNPLPESAGDGIIGSADFIATLKPQVTGTTHVPPASAADETVLFWTHLAKASMILGVTDAGTTQGSPVAFGTAYPKSTSGGFIVGHGDGSPLPKSLAPATAGLKGTILVLISDDVLQGKAELNAPEQQPLTPGFAANIDRKMDDGRPSTGYVQAYGAPACFAEGGTLYAEESLGKDCGLVFKIGD